MKRLLKRKDLALATALSGVPGSEGPEFDEWFDDTYVRNYGGYPQERKLLNYLTHTIAAGYRHYKGRNLHHNTILCVMGRKILRIAVALLKKRRVFDPKHLVAGGD